MARDIPISNGRILICFDSDYQIRDLYFPHVGEENHAMGHPFRFGVWIDGTFSWIDSPQWQKSLKYYNDTLITDVTLTNNDLGIEIQINDFVDVYHDSYIKQVKVNNLWDNKRNVKLFFHHDFRIYGNEVGDTGFYQPLWKSVIHYKKRRYFLCGMTDGVEHYSIGAKAMGHAEGTWKDAEDGELQNTIITHGSVDSTIGKYFELEGNGSYSFDYWICMGTTLNEVEELQNTLIAESCDRVRNKAEKYWHLWSNKRRSSITELPEWVQEMYKRSLLVTRTQIDHKGAILAANDSDIQAVYKDHYSYLWPRDGAMVAQALDLAQYETITQNFYKMISEIIDPQGYLLHKYDALGSLASSWHPWVRDGKAQLPIQEDETALIVWGLWQHFKAHENVEFILDLYHSIVCPAADFLLKYRDKETNLPLPSFDLWEERRGIMTYTCCTVEAGLRSASNFARLFGDEEREKEWSTAATEIKDAISKYLYHNDKQRYMRGLVHPEDHSYELIPDSTVDASLYALFRFGTFSVNDPKVQSTMKAYREHLTVKTQIGGIARYSQDWYQSQQPPSTDIPGNPWIISTLWLMIEEIYAAQSIEELEHSLRYLEWVKKYSLPSGIISEQVNPHTGEQISVSPLTWSHATVVEAIMLYRRKYEELKNSPSKHEQ